MVSGQSGKISVLFLFARIGGGEHLAGHQIDSGDVLVRSPKLRKASPVRQISKKATLKGETNVKAVILNGALPGDQSLDRVQKVLMAELKSRCWDLEPFQLNSMDIKYCTGCFGCWIQTPGICVIPDAGQEIAKAIIQSNLVIFLTPVTFGGYSSELKKALDRTICILSPFFKKVGGEIHHRPRYEQYPRLMGVGLLPHKNVESERVFTTLVERNAINWHAPAHVSKVLHDSGGVDGMSEDIHTLFTQSEVA